MPPAGPSGGRRFRPSGDASGEAPSPALGGARGGVGGSLLRRDRHTVLFGPRVLAGTATSRYWIYSDWSFEHQCLQLVNTITWWSVGKKSVWGAVCLYVAALFFLAINKYVCTGCIRTGGFLEEQRVFPWAPGVLFSQSMQTDSK